MNTQPNAVPPRPLIPAWYKIGAALLLIVIGLLFFVLASGRLRHRSYDEAPPAGTVPGQPNQVISH